MMLDPKILNALAPEVRQRFIRRLKQLEQEQAEQEFARWQAQRQGPNLREWRSMHETPPDVLSEWAKDLLAKSKTRQERMEAARKAADLNRQCTQADESRRLRKQRRARAKKSAARRRKEKVTTEQRYQEQEEQRLERRLKRMEKKLATEREREAAKLKRQTEKDERLRVTKLMADPVQCAAYLAKLNAKAEAYFRSKAEQPMPEVSMTPYNTYGGPTYKAPGMRDEDEWLAYWRLGDGMGVSRTDQLPSEWIHEHKDDESASWWIDASTKHIAKFY